MADKQTKLKTGSKGPVLFGVAVFTGLFLGLGGWLYAANLAGAVIATGVVAVEGNPKTVQHLEGGIVSEINVEDGDRVQKGDVLVRLDATLLEANLQIYRSQLQEASARRSRLLAERDGLADIEWRNEILSVLNISHDPNVREGNVRLFEARRTSLEGQVARLREQVAQFANQTSGVKALMASKDRQLDMLSDELANISGLKEKGLVTNGQVLNLERQKEDLTGQMGDHQAEMARITNSINEAEIQVLQVERDMRQQVLTELREVELQINNTAQQYQATLEQLRRVDVVAPVSGVIHELAVFTLGGVVAPGGPILQIVPQNEGFVVEANVEPQFVDDIYPGQETAVRFSAFNQRTTPEVYGEVIGISANVIVDEQTGAQFYKVKVKVGPEEMDRLNGQTLIPGMPVETYISTSERTALNYLVKPLMDQMNKAFREE